MVTPTPDHTRSERATATDRLFRAYRERGDTRARDRIVQLYMPLVAALARRHRSARAGYEELLGAGSTGLLDAVQRYVPRPRREFVEFALPIVLGEIRARLRDEATPPGPRPAVGFEDRGLDPFGALDDTERAIVRLRFEEELGPDQAAGRLAMSGAELSQRTHRVLAKIRAELELQGSGQPATARRLPSDEAPEGSLAADEKERHSGRLLLRMPQALHTELANAAEREKVSLNQFITAALAAAVGWEQPGDAPRVRLSRSSRPAPRWLPAAIVTNLVVLAIAAVLAVVVLLAAWQGW